MERKMNIFKRFILEIILHLAQEYLSYDNELGEFYICDTCWSLSDVSDAINRHEFENAIKNVSTVDWARKFEKRGMAQITYDK